MTGETSAAAARKQAAGCPACGGLRRVVVLDRCTDRLHGCPGVTVRLTTYTPAASDHGDCQAGDGGLAGWSGGRQRCGRSSSRRFCGWEPILPSTSVR